MASDVGAEQVLNKLLEENPDLLDQIGPNLKDISPEQGVMEFVEHKSEEVRPKTVQEYKNKLAYFTEFCEMREIESLSEIGFRELNQYRHWRREESHELNDPLSAKTMRDEMYLLKDFARFLEKIDALEPGLAKEINPPSLTGDEGVRDIDIADERVNAILEYLSSYEYATAEHVVWLFYASTGRRPGGLHSLDLEDIHFDCEDPYIVLEHRPEETSLKNGEGGEQQVVIKPSVAKVFKDYIEQNRVEVTSETGRSPFLTSKIGRISKSTMRKYIYKWSRPCEIGRDCPHDRRPAACQASQNTDQASKCPSSRPPYALRHGYISKQLQEGLRVKTLSERCDVSEEIIEKHYDERTPEERREFRRRQLEQLQNETDQGGFI
jgi:site-specific recombinase XerD